MPIKVLLVLGTRPEAIKMAPVVVRLRSSPEEFEVCVCVTAQHRDMLDQVLAAFGLVPDVDLDLMRPGQSPTGVAAAVLANLEPVLARECPDWVLVQGDTTTAMAAAIGAHYQRVRVGHVEAGLRTHDIYNPFPEEGNRRIVDSLSSLLFAPTARARGNLLEEGVPEATIHLTGNTVVDALLGMSDSQWQPDPNSPLAALPTDKRLILVTAHRRENFGAPLASICRALHTIALREDVHLVYPVHPNPSVQGPVRAYLGQHANVSLMEPLDYPSLVYLLKRCSLVLTDSGGLQEEAPVLGLPVLVLRQTTERPEAIEAGAARLVGTDSPRIIAETNRLLDDSLAYASMSRSVSPYGDGHASERIAQALLGAT